MPILVIITITAMITTIMRIVTILVTILVIILVIMIVPYSFGFQADLGSYSGNFWIRGLGFRV